MPRRRYGTPLPPGQRMSLRLLPARPRDAEGRFWWLSDQAVRLRLLVGGGLAALLVGSFLIINQPPPPPVYVSGVTPITIGVLSFDAPAGWPVVSGDSDINRPTIIFAPDGNPELAPTAISFYATGADDLYQSLRGEQDPDVTPPPAAFGLDAFDDGLAIELPSDSTDTALPVTQHDEFLGDIEHDWRRRSGTARDARFVAAWGPLDGPPDLAMSGATGAIGKVCGSRQIELSDIDTSLPDQTERSFSLGAQGDPDGEPTRTGGLGKLVLKTQELTDPTLDAPQYLGVIICVLGAPAELRPASLFEAWARSLVFQDPNGLPLTSGDAVEMPGYLESLEPETSLPPAISRDVVLGQMIFYWLGSGIPAPTLTPQAYRLIDRGPLLPTGRRLTWAAPFPWRPGMAANMPEPTPFVDEPSASPTPTPDPDAPVSEYFELGTRTEGELIVEMALYLPESYGFSRDGQRVLAVTLSYDSRLDESLRADAEGVFNQLLDSLTVSD